MLYAYGYHPAAGAAIDRGGQSMAPEAKTARTFRFLPATSAELDTVAEARFGGNRTRALEAAVKLASIVYGSPHGRAGSDPADALERWCAGRRRSGADD